MEHTMTREPIWKMWVDTRRRVVSFHEEAGAQLMEFRDPGNVFAECGFLYQSAVPLSVNA